MTAPLFPPPIAPSAREVAWQDRGLCQQTDPEAFYPDKGGSTRASKKVCLRCDVRAQCLQWALDKDERYGVWGGKSERERRKLRKEMGLPEAVAA